jgi:hypothetical protein
MTQTKPITDAEALFGGRDIAVQYRDGTTHTLFLRLIRISEITKFLDLIMQDEIAALKMVLPEGDDLDPDALTFEGLAALLEANLEVNFTAALASNRAKLDRATKTGLGVKGLMEDLVSLSQSFAPRSPSQPAGPPSSSAPTPFPGSPSSGEPSAPATKPTPVQESTPQE